MNIPRGLEVDQPSVFTQKVNEFSQLGASGIHAVFDFDRTLTVKHPEAHVEITTWHILSNHLPSQGKDEYRRLFEKYRAKEVDGSMSMQDAVDWWSASLNLLNRYRINLPAVESDFLQHASIRPGTAELFSLLASHGIPTIILSAGIRDVIKMWCRKYDITPSLILSTDLVLDEQGTVTGWDKSTLIHVLNKSEVDHPELSSVRTQRPKCILAGDGLDDASMASGEQDVIRIRILDPRDDEHMPDQVARTFTKFDGIIHSGSFQPLANLIHQIID